MPTCLSCVLPSINASALWEHHWWYKRSALLQSILNDEKYPRISIICYVSSLYPWTSRKSMPIFPSFRAICLRRMKFIGNHCMLFQTWNWNIVKWKLTWKLEWTEKFNHIYLNFVNVLFNFRMDTMKIWKIKKKMWSPKLYNLLRQPFLFYERIGCFTTIKFCLCPNIAVNFVFL